MSHHGVFVGIVESLSEDGNRTLTLHLTHGIRYFVLQQRRRILETCTPFSKLHDRRLAAITNNGPLESASTDSSRGILRRVNKILKRFASGMAGSINLRPSSANVSFETLIDIEQNDPKQPEIKQEAQRTVSSSSSRCDRQTLDSNTIETYSPKAMLRRQVVHMHTGAGETSQRDCALPVHTHPTICRLFGTRMNEHLAIFKSQVHMC